MNNIYCIIVTYNSLKWIDKCLSSLFKSSIQLSIIVVDNCSSDNTVNYIRDNYPSVHIIANDINKGFGQANNQGIEYAYCQGATHFFLLNQDAWLNDNDDLKVLIDIQNKYNLDVVSPIHLNGTGTKLDYGFEKCCLSNLELLSDMYFGKYHEYYILQSVNAAAWVINRKTIGEIGGFDPLFFHYGEDNNYTDRLKYHNRVIAVIPNSRIHHDRQYHGDEIFFNQVKYIAGNLVQYSNINHSLISFRMAKFTAINMYNIAKEILSFNFQVAFKTLRAGLYIARNMANIIQSRKSNKQINPNWLNIKEYNTTI